MSEGLISSLSQDRESELDCPKNCTEREGGHDPVDQSVVVIGTRNSENEERGNRHKCARERSEAHRMPLRPRTVRLYFGHLSYIVTLLTIVPWESVRHCDDDSPPIELHPSCIPEAPVEGS